MTLNLYQLGYTLTLPDLLFRFLKKFKFNSFALATPALILAFITTASAHEECGLSITQCGCTIFEPGTYTVNANLTAAQGLTERQGCVDVEAHDVFLILNGHTITGTGNGTGIGIHLLPGSYNIFLEAGANFTVGSTISGWKYGMESEAENVIVDFFYNIMNNTFGVLLKGAKNNNMTDLNAINNTVYGVWIKDGSTHNQINCTTSSGNGIAGIYIGCSNTGPGTISCEQDWRRSRKNFIYDHTADGKNDGITIIQKFGIALELGSTQNTVTNTNATGNSAFDLFDGNPNCDENLWQNNNFGKANETCIH